jgi:DNA polymerase-3 subunit epsilon
VQLQLSLTLADDLYDLLVMTGGPVDYLDAACRLLSLRAAPAAVCHRVMSTLVEEDRRFCWEGTTAIGLADWRMSDPDLSQVAFVVLDLETTGTRPGPGKITEIGAVRIEGLQAVSTFETLVNPLRPVPPKVVEITGIHSGMLVGAPRIEHVLPQLLDFLDGAVLVAHNALFDLSFLNYELTRLRGRRLGDGAIDTVSLARRAAPGLSNYRLATVAEALGSPVTPVHRALADAEATAHVFLSLVGRLQEQGITRLNHLRSHVDPSHKRDRHKLALTRDIPRSPGTYLFLGEAGEVLYVGKAERLRERVRSYFLANAGHSRKVRQAVRRVRRVDWEETGSALAAVVREQQLILEHRPACNVQGRRPENYVYLKLQERGPGLRLYASNRRGPAGVSAIGPFRGRARALSALALLHRCYPIRRCGGRPAAEGCLFGHTGSCMAPCLTEERRAEHDLLVRGLLAWLMGEEGDVDPVIKAHSLMGRLAQTRRFEEAHEVRESLDDLGALRRGYRALVEARTLCAAVFTRAATSEGAPLTPGLHLDIVWRGHLHASAGLEPATAALQIGRWLRSLPTEPLPREPLAVAQEELDVLLAVRRWLLETPEAMIIPFPKPECSADDAALAGGEDGKAQAVEAWRTQLVAAFYDRVDRQDAPAVRSGHLSSESDVPVPGAAKKSERPARRPATGS